MLIKAKKIIGCQVVTQSNYHLGRVVDFDIDSSRQNIIKYYVSTGLLGFAKSRLIINTGQIVEIQEKKVIVEDAVVSGKATVEYAK